MGVPLVVRGWGSVSLARAGGLATVRMRPTLRAEGTPDVQLIRGVGCFARAGARVRESANTQRRTQRSPIVASGG
jgi:hypothetical protein